MTKSEESKSKYQGIFVAACTPMKEDYSLDLPGIRTCIEYLVSGGLRTGTAVYVALGAGGEQMHLSTEERKAVAEAAVDAGLPADLARLLAERTVSGAGALLAQAEDDAAQLRRNVTSPGGTTEAALAVLMAADGLRPLMTRAVRAATERGRALAPS